jgi:PAS domain-containing protein
MVFTVLDITERRRAEADLRERDRSAAALFANLPGMVYRCRNDESWTMDFLSERCQEYTGYPARRPSSATPRSPTPT